MPQNEVEIRFKPADCTPANIAAILRDAADKFEEGRTRFSISEASGLIGGAVLDTAEQIRTSKGVARFLNS